MVLCLQSFSLMFLPHLFSYAGVYYIFWSYTCGVVFVSAVVLAGTQVKNSQHSVIWPTSTNCKRDEI